MTTTKIFEPFEKIYRWSRDIIVTEKIDGTNSVIDIDPETGVVLAGSRNRWITPDDDNFGFARWVAEHADDLRADLGPGKHFGEWWGAGIQRRYGLNEKRFSLFNTTRWKSESMPSKATWCHVVPELYRGPMSEEAILGCLDRLGSHGSVAAPGFMQPEGIVIFHEQSRALFKKTLVKDEEHKGAQQAQVSA